MQFVFQPLTYGFLLVLVPLLVHLINLLRHRRQRWAAMEFLLESYRRNRRWVWLKQWLLLLSRMLVMAILVAMLAQWVSGSRLLGLLGQSITHHYILLDDSFSMADSAQGESAYQSGLKAIAAIANQAAQDNGQHQITVLRWSRAALATAGASGAPADSIADIMAQTIPSDPSRLLDRINATTPSSLELSPVAALQLIQPSIRDATGETANVYVVSDFRRNQWDKPDSIREAFQPLQAAGANLELIDCVRAAHENLSIIGLEPDKEVLAAGVPVFVQVQVRNYGLQAARNVVVKTRAIEYADDGSKNLKPNPADPYSGTVVDLPPVVIDIIPPGESVTRRFQTAFATQGQHVIEATLPDDAVAADNKRWCVLPLVQGRKVLLVDGDIDGRNAFLVGSALNPGGSIRTGMQVETKSVAFLRETNPLALLDYAAIFLLDVPRLDTQAVTNLEAYVDQGGGIAVFGGPNLNLAFYNDSLHREGSGLLPLALGQAVDLPPPTDVDQVDMQPNEHPIFQPLMGLSGAAWRLVNIKRFFNAPGFRSDTTKPETNSANSAATDSASKPDNNNGRQVQVLATLRGGKPLIVEKTYGDGRVIQFLTGLESSWSNWAQDPTFIVITLKMVGYLTSSRQADSSQLITAPLTLQQASSEALPEVRLLAPSRSGGSRLDITQAAQESPDGQIWNWQLAIDPSNGSADLVDALLLPGVFELWVADLQGGQKNYNIAHHVPPAEGDLGKSTSREMISALRPVDVKHRWADSLTSTAWTAGLNNRNMLLMGLLLAMMALEQALAYIASFHPPRSIGATR